MNTRGGDGGDGGCDDGSRVSGICVSVAVSAIGTAAFTILLQLLLVPPPPLS